MGEFVNQKWFVVVACAVVVVIIALNIALLYTSA